MKKLRDRDMPKVTQPVMALEFDLKPSSFRIYNLNHYNILLLTDERLKHVFQHLTTILFHIVFYK